MTSGVARGHDAAEQALARDYELLRGHVVAALRSKLSAQRVHVDEGDLDEVYNQAWHALYMQLAGGAEIESRAGFLVTVGYRRAIDELRRLHPDRYDAGADTAAIGVDVDLASRLDDTTRMRHLIEGLRERLDAREQRAAALCLIHGYTRPEAATALGLSGRRMEKVMDGVTRKLAQLTGEIADDWCRSRASLIAAYALGVLEDGGERHEAAVEHLRDCSACRRSVNQRRGLAAVLPPIGLPLVLGGALAKGGAGAGAGLGLLHRFGRLRPHGGGSGSSHAVTAAASAGGIAAVALVVLGSGGALHGGGSRHPAPPSSDAALPVVAPLPARTSRVAHPHRTHRAAPRRHPKHVTTTTVRAAVPAPQATTPPSAPSTPAPASAPPAAKVAPSKPAVVTDAAQEFGPEH
jgi:DNA-directed RNA polymerase specialized sigma24 family protein